MNISSSVLNFLGSHFASFLGKQVKRYDPVTLYDEKLLLEVLKPGDIVLVEGRERISTAIKYLTQSTWSHACMYVGDIESPLTGERLQNSLIEADLKEGVITQPLSMYANYNIRIVRAISLSQADCQVVIDFMVASLGKQYDLKNVLDLLRFVVSTPPVPVRFRRRLLALGSGEPTKAICSTLIAQAFQKVRYPILPLIEEQADCYCCPDTAGEVLHIRHHSLFVPRDFDLSPYFKVIKPGLDENFDYKALVWGDQLAKRVRNNE
ncbi:MAG: lipo-like protein [Gammaproteobacteria bacterium]|nr:MAG: lipo-like protein [Gammaproteobacteria bacterium]RLA24439.1 MAG: lipo-like protein [Gammaproteobacteria bacterium]